MKDSVKILEATDISRDIKWLDVFVNGISSRDRKDWARGKEPGMMAGSAGPLSNWGDGEGLNMYLKEEGTQIGDGDAQIRNKVKSRLIQRHPEWAAIR
jgi:hypothetical protein